jgi:hypothetical protein
VNRRGVIYDTGTILSGPGWKVPTRPKLDLAIAERELQIARDDLRCNAVRVGGHDLDRLTHAAERAHAPGLEVSLSPALFGGSPDETLHHFVSAAEQAERLYRTDPDRVVLVMGSELTLMVKDIVPGRDFAARAGEAITRVRQALP